MDIINAIFRLAGGGGLLFFLPLPGITKIPFGNVKQLVDSIRDLHAFILAHIESHEKSLDTDNPRDFIDQYLIKLSETEVKLHTRFVFKLKGVRDEAPLDVPPSV